jgi:hypothetical protein
MPTDRIFYASFTLLISHCRASLVRQQVDPLSTGIGHIT